MMSMIMSMSMIMIMWLCMPILAQFWILRLFDVSFLDLEKWPWLASETRGSILGSPFFFFHLSSWVELKNLLIPNSLGSRPRPFLTDFEFSRLTTCWIRSPQILSFSAYKTSIHFHTFPKCLMCVLDHRFLPVPWFQCLCPSLSTFYWIWVHVWPYDAFFLNHLMNGFNYVILNSVGKNNFPPGPLFALELEWWARKCCYLPGFYFFGTFAFHQATKEIYGFHLAEGYLDNLSYWC
jgi:hypothetical protein